MLARLMGLKTVSPADLQQLIERQEVTVIDVNAAQKWQKAHVPGARNLDPEEYNENDLPSDKNAGLIFIVPTECAAKHRTPPGVRRRWVIIMSGSCRRGLMAGRQRTCLPREESRRTGLTGQWVASTVFRT